MRAAILARFSTDRQREASCDDQVRVCTVRAEAEGWRVIATYRDEAVSGSVPVAQRPGGAKMLADALAGRFDVLLLEGLDRLSRDLVEQERVVRRLEHRGIRIVGVSDGYDSVSKSRKLHRGMRGLINEIYLDDLREKVHRGLDGLVARKLFAGGLAYGYRSVPQTDGHRLAVDPEQARWVRFIFERHAEGWSPQRIAAELNRLGVRSPRGSSWAVGAIYGSPKKGTGILNNVLYVGEYIWNRSQWLKDPDTGKRRRIERPPHEWRTVSLPELRIVSDELWNAARKRIGRRQPGEPKRPPRTLLAGLLRCGGCGGAVVAVDARAYGCAARKDRGRHVCEGVTVPRVALERTLLAFAREYLLSDEAIAELEQLDREAWRQAQQHQAAEEQARRARLVRLERDVQNLVNAIAEGLNSEMVRRRLAAAEAEAGRLRAELARGRVVHVPDRIPDMAAALRRLLDDLPEQLRRRPEQARAALRSLLGPVTLAREGDEVVAELGGAYEGILAAIPAGQALRDLVAGDRYRIAKCIIQYRVRIPKRVA